MRKNLKEKKYLTWFFGFSANCASLSLPLSLLLLILISLKPKILFINNNKNNIFTNRIFFKDA